MTEHFDKQDIINSCLDSLKECSNDNNCPMTNIQNNVINFDKFKKKFCEEYLNINNLKDEELVLKSVDSYLELSNNFVILIEFKNGQMSNNQKTSSKVKLKDSLLILKTAFDIDLKTAQNSIIYLLVYNQEKNKGKVSAPLRRCLGKKTTKKYYTYWDFDKYSGSLVKDVFTLNKIEFEKYFTNEIQKQLKEIQQYSFKILP